MQVYKFNICNPHHNKRIITDDHKTTKSNRLKKNWQGKPTTENLNL